VSTNTKPPQLPGWVKPASRLIVGLQARGISFLSFHVLAIPGRKSGRMLKTVVSPFEVDGKRYVLSFGQLQWVRNARSAGWGLLGRGRTESRVALVEIRTPESAAIVREFPRQVPAGVQFFVRLGLVDKPAGPDQFAAAADRLALFRLDGA
jgi:hypothetical protein